MICRYRKHKRWPIPLRKAAALIGCSPSHLSEVLRGQRVSARVIEAYRALVQARADARDASR